MQPFSYHSSEEKLNYEKEIKRFKPINWGKLIYRVIVVGIVLTILSYFTIKILFSISNGQVELYNFEVVFPFAVQIECVDVEEQSFVEDGDTLFSYRPIDFDENITRESQLWVSKETLSMDSKLRMARFELREVNHLIKLEKEFAAKLLIMIQQSYKSRFEYDKQLLEIGRLEAKANRLRSEIYYLKNDFRGRMLVFGDDVNNMYGTKYYTSPIEGKINRVQAYESEYVDQTKILSITNDEEVYINAYVLLEDMNLYKLGEEVIILFPDYTLTRGVIQYIYQKTELLPIGIQQFDEQRFQLVKLIPTNEEEKKEWKTLNGVSVKIILTNFNKLGWLN